MHQYLDMSGSELQSDIDFLFRSAGVEIKDFKDNEESLDYSACSFVINGYLIQYRQSKVTPTKIGQFVTIWKRNKERITVPYHADEIDFIIIYSQVDSKRGLFIFPKHIL